jgi:hypothetical protein
MKENKGVIDFHKKMGAIQTGEDHQNFYFEISKETVDHARSILKDKLS